MVPCVVQKLNLICQSEYDKLFGIQRIREIWRIESIDLNATLCQNVEYLILGIQLNINESMVVAIFYRLNFFNLMRCLV
jgi:hypothetical protein